MCSTDQPDGGPYGGSELRSYFLPFVDQSTLNYHKFSCAGVSIVCNAIFRLTMTCCVPEIFAIKSQSCAKLRQNFDVFGPPNFGERGHPNFWPNFINLGHHRTCGTVWWRSDNRPGRLGGEKKKDLNYSGDQISILLKEGRRLLRCLSSFFPHVQCIQSVILWIFQRG